ncbi:Cycloheximide resistance protein [Candida maltosa Xu316]|uniref:Cycloheximide resistance protein n=1 Tax=Candida maltosa (strain Xu316) TaxID=1245528 RepID=M3HDT8_CANMX|nr:Cycloheximide resistance protein [Candida maltosa Xu316]
MAAFIKDSFWGQIIYRLSGRKLFRHNDELPDYVVPEKYLLDPKEEVLNSSDKSQSSENKEQTEGDQATIQNEPASDHIIVTWDGDDDPENPYNWPFAWKAIAAMQIGFLTVSVYMASAIYTPGVEEIMNQFNINSTLATLPLTMFVIGYGIGPLFWSPLSENSRIGRTPLYIITLFIFFILQIPTALSNHIAGLSVLRVIAGFFAAPALSTGGASYGDFIAMHYYSIALGVWSIFAVAGPSIGPLIGAAVINRSHDADGWRWSFWFMAILSGVCFIVLSFSLPETYGKTLLRRKAERLRKLTGNNRIISEGELEDGHKTTGQVVSSLLWRPLEITMLEPVVFLIDIYIALVYSIMYLFFESVPIVYAGIHHFTLVEMGATYVSTIIGIIIGGAIYLPTVYYKFTKKLLAGHNVTPEVFLPPAIFGAICMPIGVFIFGWTSSPDINWFVPLIGMALFAVGAFIIFQTLFNYMAVSFKVEYLASVFSSNAFFRSVSAGAFPLFGRALYNNLSIDKFPVGWGSSILGFISLGMIAIPVFFYLNGPKLRARSKYAY